MREANAGNDGGITFWREAQELKLKLATTEL
jgi:hypothetical protein